MNSNKVTPSEVNLGDLTLYNCDLQKHSINYTADETKKLVFPLVKSGNAAFRIQLNGVVASDGIIVSEEWGTHSLLFEFSNIEDITRFDEIEKYLLTVGEEEDFTLKTMLRDEKIFLKLRFDKKKARYTFSSNVPKLSPKNPQAGKIFRYDTCSVTADVGTYFNFEDKICGLTLKITDLQVTSVVE